MKDKAKIMPPKVTTALTVVTESTRTFSEALSALDCCICLDTLADDAAEAEALRAATAPLPSNDGNTNILQSFPFGAPQQQQQQPLTSSSSLVEASLFAQQQQSAAAASSGGDRARAVCALPCGHLFHVGCVSEHLEARKNYSRDAECPLCRSPIPRWTPEELKARADLRTRLASYALNGGGVGGIGGGGIGSSRKGPFGSQQQGDATINASMNDDFIPDPPAAYFMEEATTMLEALAARGRQAAARGARGRGGRQHRYAPQPPAIVSEEAVLALAASLAAARGAAARQDARSRKVAASSHEGTFKMYILNMNRRLAVEPLKPPQADGSSSPTADGEGEEGDGDGAENQSPFGSPRAEEFVAAAASASMAAATTQSSATHVRRTLLQFTPTAACAPPTTAAAAASTSTPVPAIANAPNLHRSNFVGAAPQGAKNDEGSVGDVIFLTPAEAKQQLHSKHHEALTYLSRKTRAARERHDAEKNLASRVVGLTAALHNLEAATAALANDSRIAEGLAELNARRFSIEQHRLRDGSFFRPCEVAAVYYKKAAAAVTERAALQTAYEAALLEQEELDAALADAEAEAARAQAAETQSDEDDGGDGGSTTEDEDKQGEASNGLRRRAVTVAIGGISGSSGAVGLSARERLSRDLRMRSGAAKAVAASTKRARSPLSELLFQQQRSRCNGNESETATSVQLNARSDAVCVDSTTATRRPTTAAPWHSFSVAIDLEATDDSSDSNSNTRNGNQAATSTTLTAAAPATSTTTVAVEYPPFMRATSDEDTNGYGYAAVAEQQLCWATPATAVATQPSSEGSATMVGGDAFTGVPAVVATEASAPQSATACAHGGPIAPLPPIFSASFPSSFSSPSSSPNGGLASPPATQADGGWRQR